MFKKDDLEEFLLLFNKAETIPFSNREDALVNNFNVLDIPFKNYSETIIGWYDYLKVEISENLLSLKADDRELYLNFLNDKLRQESSEFDNKRLVDLLKYYDVAIDALHFSKNEKLEKLLHTSFKSISGNENLFRFRDLNREYYKYLLNIERSKIIEYITNLIETKDHKEDPVAKKDEDYVWFKVGLLFAKGEVQQLYKKYKSERGHFKRITLELGFKKTDRPHFSETINNMTNHRKNIYRNLKKMKTIHDYCVRNKIPVNEQFMNVYKGLQTK